MVRPGSGGRPAGLTPAASAILREVALRAETAVQIETDVEITLLRSIVDATVGIFAAEAASIALVDDATGDLRFVVAAGAQGQPVVGMTIPATQGVAGYVFSTGESIAMADPVHDPRFGRAVAEQTGYVPRSILAVPLEDGVRTIGVLEVFDKRAGPFTLQDIEIASLFARQAATAIKVAARTREVRSILADALRADTPDEEAADSGAGASAEAAPRGESDAAVAELVSAATRRQSGDDRFWAFVDAIAAMRHATAADRDLAIDLLTVIARHRAPTQRDAPRGLGRARR
jgi:signal transduction protein with GAF and PtsI domain